MFGLSASEGSFEDADKASDFLSQTHQHYDLRHTIPGEPDKDYPIYSAVPSTSFSCAQRHEGYYADMESRCQAFHICTHTARNSAGFGFLCPNGTLFSQRHFVCDWYRNVRCEESEQFYNKNVHNHIGSNFEMMETVRKMIEYPMKTISKALSQKQANTKIQTPRPYTVQAQENRAPQPTVVSFAQKQTLPNVQKQTNSGTTLLRPIVHTTPKVIRGEAVQSLPIAKNTHDVYVNRFGELSTDPGTKFDPNTARILAKPEKSGKTLNFAESINFGLNEYFPHSNRNQKSNKNEGDLGSNLNILRHEIQAELNPKKPVHRSTSSQESTLNFNNLSQGFSKTKKDYSKSSRYQSSKQTTSTTKFSSNDFSTDIYKETTHENHKQNSINTENPKDIQFTFMHTTQSTPVTVDSFLINSFFDIPSEPIADEIEPTNTDDVEDIFFKDSTDMERNDNDVIQINFESSTEKFEEAPTTTTTTTTTTTIRPSTTITLETTEATVPDTTEVNNPETTESSTVQALPLIKNSNNYLVEKKTVTSLKEVQKDNGYDDTSFITDLQLLENLIDDEKVIPTTTPRPEKEVMQTSTEMIMSVNAVETRVRTHRRFNSSRNRAKTTDSVSAFTTTTIRPHIKRPQLRRNMTTTITSERPTIMKERRQHHSHHSHYSRKYTRGTTTVTPQLELNVETEVSENHSSRKLNVRNIDSHSKARGNSLSADNKMKASVRYGSINNQRRRTTTTTSTTIKPTNTRNRQNIIRSRGSQSGIRGSRTTSTTKSTSTTTRTPKTTTTTASSVENIVGENIEIIPLNVSLINTIDSATTTSTPSTSISLASSSTTTSTSLISNTDTNNTEKLNNDIVESLLPFNELTRAIVDESILQNYRTNQQTQIYPQQQGKPQVYFKTAQPIVPVLPSFPTTATKTQSYATQTTANTNIFPQGPNIVIARAEGQRIDATSHTPYLQHPQHKVTKVASGTSYESLNEFLSKKFGQTNTGNKPATNYYATSPKNVFATQQNQYFTQQQRNLQIHFPINVQQQQQQQTKHIVYAQPAQQQQSQQYSQSAVFKNLQQQQQPQLTFIHNNQLSQKAQANNYRQSLQQQQQTGTYRNIKLPTLNDGIIPAAYTPVAQRRLDSFNFELETSTLPRTKLFTGVSSYDVPLNSVGRLPNDKSQRLRRY